jgi:rare lipoprotein A
MLRYTFLFLLFMFSSHVLLAGKHHHEKKAESSKIKFGIASYYASKFEGRETYNGSHYNSKLLTAACNILPMGTHVRVTNLRNGKTLVVKINDKLHPRNRRLIDLSAAGASMLGFMGRGITRVKLEILGKKAHFKERKEKEIASRTE